MGIVNNIFFLDLNSLDKKIDENLKKFAKSEDLEVEDVVKIIYNEANKIGEKDKVKVTFKIVDGDSFRVVVESANVKYKGTIIYPFEKIKSDDFEFKLDSVCGKVTLYNKKEECRKISVTIDYVALDIFSMTYKKAVAFLKDISDRKQKGGYIEYPDAICFRDFGVKVNCRKSESGDARLDDLVGSIDIFNKEEFFKEYYFEDVKKEHYDVNIPLPDEYNYDKRKVNKVVKDEIKVDEASDIEIELPNAVDKEKEKEEIAKKREEELERIRAKQDEELEKVKDKLKKELEEQLSKSLKKYDEQNEKRLNDEINKQKELEETVNIEIPEAEEKSEDNKEEEKIEVIPEESIIENQEEDADHVEEQKIPDNIKQDIKDKIENGPEIEIEPIEIVDEKSSVEVNKTNNIIENKEKEETLTENQKEILELEKLLEEEKKQQEALENRIKAKLEELKSVAKSKLENEVDIEIQDITEPVKVNNPEGFTSYTIESYKGIQEQGKDELSVFFGQDKKDVRKYFGGAPKEIRDYDEMELYDIFYAYYDEEDKCTGIGIYNQEVYKDKIALYMFGQNLITMKYRDIVKLIKKNDYNAIEDDDGIISLKYGISVDPKEDSNYKDEISDVIHIFKKGYYDEVYENF